MKGSLLLKLYVFLEVIYLINAQPEIVDISVTPNVVDVRGVTIDNQRYLSVQIVSTKKQNYTCLTV
jgi:hypothetical protein